MTLIIWLHFKSRLVHKKKILVTKSNRHLYCLSAHDDLQPEGQMFKEAAFEWCL